MRTGFPIVVFKYKHLTYTSNKTNISTQTKINKHVVIKWEKNKKPLTFCQFFLSKETKKLTLICTFWKICFSSMLQFPTATPIQRTFFSWNLTVALVSLTFASRDSWCETRVGNLPALLINITQSKLKYVNKHI